MGKKAFYFLFETPQILSELKTTLFKRPNLTPQLHGFGLSNVKLILEKYNGDFTMDYEDNWFQFTGEISQ